MIDINELVQRINPSSTVLFLGAGACVPSGAPSGPQLAHHLWAKLAGGDKLSDDLIEVSSILENRVGREQVIREIRAELGKLQPTGGLLSLPVLDWHAIYTTNYDQLIEIAYSRSGKYLIPIRSNFDWAKVEGQVGVKYYKIHGCLTQDSVDGSKARMVLTERDYEEYADFRETIFKQLELDFSTKSVLIVGHSLRDPHLRRDIKIASELKRNKGAPGRIYVLVYERDDDRAFLLEQRGLSVAFGGVDGLVDALTSGVACDSPVVAESDEFELPPSVRSCTIDAKHQSMLNSNPKRLFDGGAATYADVKAGLTFQRSAEQSLLNMLRNKSKKFVTIVGVAGVGKTTLARRLMCALDNAGFVWEHNSNFPLRAEGWLGVEAKLRHAGMSGVLLVDDCAAFLRHIDTLANALARTENSALSLVLTANSSQWEPRRKSAQLFACGHVEKLSAMMDYELEQLINLVDAQVDVARLVGAGFKRLTRPTKMQRLRRRCSADMFVCLKNIFASDAIDAILLREYAELDAELQDVYRVVSALESCGAKVHRQLVLRILNMRAEDVPDTLKALDGLVEEFPVNVKDGVYNWATRHEVVAQTIVKYKFSGKQMLLEFFRSVVSNLNPAVWLELRMLRDICNIEFGIGRLADSSLELQLYEELIRRAPGERVPRHRLVSTLLSLGRYEEAAQVIKEAEAEVGFDSVFSRYKVRCVLQRAESISGILKEDRIAMVREAERLALVGLNKLVDDKYAYMAYADVGAALAELSGDLDVFDDAIAKMRVASEKLLDPQLVDSLNRYERQRTKFRST